MIQRRTRDYEVSLWSLQDSLIAILKQYGLEFKGQIEEGKLTDRDDGTQTFSFKIPMYYHKDGKKIENPSWYNVTSGKLIANMRKVKVIFNKDDLLNRKIYEFLIVKVSELHNDDNSLYCSVECEGLAFHELGKIGYKISLSPEDFYNDDYDYATNNKWIDSTGELRSDKPLATLNYWNDRVFSTINNWSYEIQMNWDAYSLLHKVKDGVLADYTVENDKVEFTQKRLSDRVYEEDFIDSWDLVDNKLLPKHITYAREKARVSVDIKESNIYNITQTLAETFGVFCRYEYEYNLNCQIVKRKVVYYNNFLNEALGTIDISYPYQTSSIKRNIDSTDLVTKLFVKSVDDPNSGALSIIDVGANDMGEDYILNFDYLHEIGGITDEQYAAVEEYKVKIKKLNQEIAPVSAKVISLQSQLVKLEAELTTRKNAIIQDTEQLLSNTALLDAITNGNDILKIDQNNPQLATLILDATDTLNTTYYVKITQQGVYPETIKLYRTYSYNNHALQDPLLTGEIVFDDAGEVIRVRKLWLDPTKPKLKTVYITYSYRPTLYYERVVNMWKDRQHNDLIQRDILTNQIAQIKYSLYGEDKVSQEELKNMDVTNLFDLKIYDKYQNLLQEKQNTIKLFNAMMGPALREGYWQPENYNDYGDQYNDRFNISLSAIPDEGSTKNTVFKWDDELFEGEQDVFYRISAAEYKQAYPCIDLTTPNGKQILKLITTSKTPISYVYQPRTAENDLIGLDGSPQINAPTSLVYIPNLWIKENDEWKMKSVLNELLKLLYQNKYKGRLECSITPSTWKYGYSFFYYYKNDTKTPPILQYNITSEDPPHQITPSDDWKDKIDLFEEPQKNTSPFAQLRLDENDGAFNLIFKAMNKSGDSIVMSTTKTIPVRPITTEYSITQDNTIKNQTVLTNLTKSFDLTYTIKPENDYYSDLETNLYTWHISHNGATIKNIPYIYDLNTSRSLGQFEINNTSVNYSIQIKDNSLHNNELILSFQLIPALLLYIKDSPLVVSLSIKTPVELLKNEQDQSSISSGLYTIKGDNGAPIFDLNQISDTGAFILPSTCNTRTLSVSTYLLQTPVDSSRFSATWKLGNDIILESQSDDDEVQYHIVSRFDEETLRFTSTLTIIINTLKEQYDILNNKVPSVLIAYDQKSNLHPFDSISIYPDIHYLLPEESQDTSLLHQLAPIGLQNTSTPQLYDINFTTVLNATLFIWEIIPANDPEKKPIQISTAQDTTSNDRYSASLITNTDTGLITGSKLTITIPPLGAEKKVRLRDNGTRIKCICRNGGGLKGQKSYPEIGYKSVTITLLSIVSQGTTTKIDWWPMLISMPLGTVYFSLPIDDLNITNNLDEIFSITTNITYNNIEVSGIERNYLLLHVKDNIYKCKITGRIINQNNENNEDNDTLNQWLTTIGITTLSPLVESAEKNTTTTLDMEVTIKFQNIFITHMIIITVKTTGPLLEDDKDPNLYDISNSDDKITWSYTDNTLLPTMSETVSPNIRITMEKILKIKDINSIEAYTWDCKPAESKVVLQYKWNIKNMPLLFNRKRSYAIEKTLPGSKPDTYVTIPDGQYAKDFIYGLIGSLHETQQAGEYVELAGYSSMVYLNITNPYGTVRSKYIRFVQADTKR